VFVEILAAVHRVSKSFSLEIGINMFELSKIIYFLEMRKIFHSPLANFFSNVLPDTGATVAGGPTSLRIRRKCAARNSPSLDAGTKKGSESRFIASPPYFL
jgi:hypothetical protein